MGRRTRKKEGKVGVCVLLQGFRFAVGMNENLRMRLYSLGAGGCPVGVLPGKVAYISREESREDS